LEDYKPNFNKIRLGGLSADLRAYAYTIEEVAVADPLTRQPVMEKHAHLWYLDMVSRSREAVKAIWAGLVNNPPKPVVLYSELQAPDLENPGSGPNEPTTPGSMWARLAPSDRSGGYRWSYMPLSKACAHHGVVLPQAALAKSTRKSRRSTQIEKENTTNSKSVQGQASLGTDATLSASQGAETEEIETPGEEFLLLWLAEFGKVAEQNLPEKYFGRVDALSHVPLLPDWSDWLWEFGRSREPSLCQPLLSYGCEAWLCRAPSDKALAAALKETLSTGRLTVPTKG
jgi:hypothetical protein